MSRAAAFPARDIHPQRCDCATCEPYLHAQASRLSAADRIGMLITAGTGVGLAAAWVLDRVTGGPGISVMWGA